MAGEMISRVLRNNLQQHSYVGDDVLQNDGGSGLRTRPHPDCCAELVEDPTALRCIDQ